MFAELTVQAMQAIERALLLAENQLELGVVDSLVLGQRLESAVLPIDFLHQFLFQVATLEQGSQLEDDQQCAVGAPVAFEAIEIMETLH